VVSVSTSRSRDGLETYQRLVSVSSREKLSTSRSRLGLIHLRLVPKINFRLNSAGHSTQCEWALDVTYAVVTTAHHINTLKTMNVKDRPVIAINKTCTLTSRSRLESYKRLVSVSSRNFNVSSRSLLCW